MTQNIWLVAGLGNPGKKYEHTWHNSGYQALDRLAAKHRLPIERIRFHALTAEGQIEGNSCLLVKPLTYMNLSGEAVRDAACYYQIPPENILVIYDDIDLACGSIRIRRSGGPGTHNGMRSMIECLKSQSFPRIRIGIGPKPEQWDLADFVLSKIQPELIEPWSAAVDLAVDAAELILKEGLSGAMATLNRR
ncbi:MAG: aminoacyl-tRNA hydrolase [Bacillota bacterium]|nr:aminoacyl-tRNA hydrolase [Bacillota bacterium]